MRKMLLAVTFSIVLIGGAHASVYKLFSVNGAGVVGDGPSAVVSVEQTSPGFVTPFPGFEF